jgi:hypothetical protein
LLELLVRDVITSSSVGRNRGREVDVVDAWTELATGFGKFVAGGGDVDG